MRVAFDTNAVFSGPPGVRTYVLELLPELIRVLEPEDELVLLFAEGQALPEQVSWMLRGDHLTSSPLPKSCAGPATLHRRIGFPPVELLGPRGRRLRGVEVCHTVQPPLLPTSARTVLTVHTLEGSLREGGRPNRSELRSLRRADLVIAPSQRVKGAIVDAAEIDEERIEVIPNGVHQRFAEPPKPADVESLCASYPFLQEPYLLALGGAAEPKRNFPFLLDAFTLARREEESLPPLVVVATPAGAVPSMQEIEERGLEGQVLLIEDLSNDALPALYRGAEILLYPAFDNAFGQGLLEATASGVPAVADPSCGVLEYLPRGVSTPEQQPDAWAEEVVRLHREPDRRSAAGKLASSAARSLTWNASAHAHREAYARSGGE